MKTLFLTENITFNDVFCIPSIVFIIFIIVIPMILAIILLADRMSIPYILDSEADYQRRLKEKERPRSVIDLSFYFIPGRGRGKPFVYDRLDPTGYNMSRLFGTYSTQAMSHNNKQGYVLGNTAFKEGDKVIMRASSVQLNWVEREGGAVLSNGSAIEKGGTNSTGTAVFVRKSQ